MIPSEQGRVKSFTFDVERFRKQFLIDPTFVKTTKVDSWKEDVLNREVWQLAVDVVTDKYEEDRIIEFYKPRTWWQHFKQDCFPKWLRQRFPVKYYIETRVVSLNHLRVYPEIELPQGHSDKYIIHEFITEK